LYCSQVELSKRALVLSRARMLFIDRLIRVESLSLQMIKPLEIAFVCYAVTDLKRARDFYESVLLLKPSSVWEGENMGFIEYEMGPHTLAIGAGAEQFKPGTQGGTAALEVENFNEAIAWLREKKVKVLMEAYETPVCHMALIQDPDGNQIMVHKRKQS
jgi:predicted enzyme related to lactoylglutathione lyase